MSKHKAVSRMTIAALVVLGAAICAAAQTQNPAAKRNSRQETIKEQPQPERNATPADDAIYSYEFQKPEFYIRHILIRHDAQGRGQITFERLNEEPIVEPLALSDASRARILSLWEALRFLDSSENYQSERQYPQLGTMRLKMTRGTRERSAEFNWTNDATARALTDEYRRVGNQAIFIFDITVARENQPLNSPKLLDLLDNYIDRKELTDPQQLIPLIQELSTDERLPLIARNHAGRILKKLGK